MTIVFFIQLQVKLLGWFVSKIVSKIWFKWYTNIAIQYITGNADGKINVAGSSPDNRELWMPIITSGDILDHPSAIDDEHDDKTFYW